MSKLSRIKSSKALPILLALVLVLATATPAFAEWTSFQRNNVNNGRLVNAPTAPAPSYTSVTLPGEIGATGVNTTPVTQIVAGAATAYTLYDGGVASATYGGARLSSVNLETAAENWNIRLDAAAGGSQQLSTPYLDSANDILYAGVTYYDNKLQGTSVGGWKDANNNPLVSFSFPANTATTIHYDNLSFTGDYYSPQLTTDIMVTAGLITSCSAALTGAGGTYNLTAYPTAGYNLNFYGDGSTLIPGGAYTLSMTINPTSTLAPTNVQYLISHWKLYKVEDVDTTPDPDEIAGGDGQINTPIDTAGGYLYFGIYEGDRCFYQCTTGGTKTPFPPAGGEDFYWAGAAKYDVDDDDDYVVFGSESGTVYMRPRGANFGDLAYGSSITLPGAGNIRSSICYDENGGNFYCTSKGGYLWQIPTNLSSAASVDIKDPTYATASTSTPVVSDNGIVYVGCYNSFSGGAVKGVPAAAFAPANLFTVYTGANKPVQCSVTAYSDTINLIDYIYFTTNSGPGTGYCYSVDPFSTPVATAQVWSKAAVNYDYTLQGMATEDSAGHVYMAFGDNADYATGDCKLYIVH